MNQRTTELLEPDFVRRLDQLELISRKIFAGKLRGERRSKRKGESVEFADYRGYVAGDDLRYLDWNIYARLDTLFIKLFLQEEDLHVSVLVDTSRSMDFGDPGKSLYARRIAATIAYIGMSNLDDASVVSIGADLGASITRMRGKGKVWRLFEFLDALPHAGETDLKRCMRRFISLERRRGVVIVLSDLYDRDGIIPGLRLLKGRRHETYVIHVMDREEQQPPLRGDLRLVDSETGLFKDITVTDAMRVRYHEAFEEHARRVETYCAGAEIGYVRALTEVPFDTLVLKILKRGGLLV